MPSFDEVILQIHRCALEPANWTSVLDDIASLVCADKAMLLTPGSERAAELLHATTGAVEQALVPYGQYYHAHDPYLLGARRRGLFQTSAVVTDDELVDRREFLASSYFNDFARRFELNRALSACVVDEREHDRRPPTVLTLYRDGQEGFSAEQVKTLRVLVPHLTIAVRSYWQWTAMRAEAQYLSSALNTVNGAVFAISQNGRLLFANRLAEHELSREAWFEVKDGRLCAARTVVEHNALEAALRALREGDCFSLHVRTSTDSSGAVITGAPYRETVGSAHAQDVAAVVWLLPARLDRGPTRIVAELFQLSAAEERLLRYLADGLELREAAAIQGIAFNTVRGQLKSIFAKTGRKRQSELSALVNRIATLRFGS